jgi:hypothetical protein
MVACCRWTREIHQTLLHNLTISPLPGVACGDGTGIDDTREENCTELTAAETWSMQARPVGTSSCRSELTHTLVWLT